MATAREEGEGDQGTAGRYAAPGEYDRSAGDSEIAGTVIILRTGWLSSRVRVEVEEQ